MKAISTVRAVLELDVAEYVLAVRESGRHYLDPAFRGRMAELYVDLHRVLSAPERSLTSRERKSLRLAELVLQSEWKLADQSGLESVSSPLGPVAGPRGKRYQPYSNVRVLNHVLGTRRSASDASIEWRCRRALRFLLRSWSSYERRSAAGTESWGWQRMPTPSEMSERLERLAELEARTEDWPGGLGSAPAPPACWQDYICDTAHGDVLEYLVNLPQTPQHEENVFLRVIHLTEVTTSAMLARTIATRTWLERGRLREAAACLGRAADLAWLQYEVMRVLRRTMSVSNFLGFRKETGNASAVQMTSSQTLHVQLLGVDPSKVEALGGAPENAFLLRYANDRFRPLRALLQEVPRTSEEGRRVLAAAHALDESLYAWRRLHLGLAHRYLSKEETGSGGTEGAPYLAEFYQDRLFDAEGAVYPQPKPFEPPQQGAVVLPRPVFCAMN